MATESTTEAFDFEGDEFEYEIDLSLADFQGDWFVLEITDTNVTKQINPNFPKPSVSALIKFRIVDDPVLDDQGVSTFLALSSTGINAVKKKAAFVAALNGGKPAEKKVTLTLAKEFSTEGSERVILKGLKGERVGAFVSVNDKGFLGVKDDQFIPAEDVETKRDLGDDAPF